MSVSVVPGAAALFVGDTMTLRAIVLADPGADETVLWSSADPSRLSVTPTGFIRVLSAGPVPVTATARADGTKFGTATISGSNVASPILWISSIINAMTGAPANLSHLSGTVSVNVSLIVGSRVPGLLYVIATRGGRDSVVASATVPTALLPGQLIQVPLGVNTAALSAMNQPEMPDGVYLLAARLTDASGELTSSAASQVTVANAATLAPVASVSVNPPSTSIPIGGATQLAAILRDAQGNELSQRSVVWTSSDPSRATVDASTGLVTGVDAGAARIIATSEGRTGSATVTVSAPVATIIAVAPSSVTLTAGCSFQLSAQAKDASGNAISSSVQWETASPGVALVSQAGLLLGIAPGSTTITARVGSVFGTATVHVQASLPGAGNSC
jgi:uncharacterized protein YjdB